MNRSPVVVKLEGEIAIPWGRLERDARIALGAFEPRSDWATKTFRFAPRFAGPLLEWATRYGLTVARDVRELEGGWRQRSAYLRALSSAEDGQVPAKLDALTSDLGLSPMRFQRSTIEYILAARRCVVGDVMGTGKGHPSSFKILTPNGWSPVGDLREGDFVIGSNGKATLVTGTFRRGFIPVSRVSFSDGTSTICDNDHLWRVRTPRDRQRDRPGRVMATWDLKHRIHSNLSIPMVEPVEFEPSGPLPVDPYLMGVLLGDGSFKFDAIGFAVGDKKRRIVEEASRCLPVGMELRKIECKGRVPYYGLVAKRGQNPIRRYFREVGLWGLGAAKKFVPDQYLWASPSDRLSLLQGLIDTDGEARPRDNCLQFCSSSLALADAVTFLVQSLGGTVRRSIKATPRYRYKGEVRIGLPSYRVTIALPDGIRPGRRDNAAYGPRIKYPPVRIIRSIEDAGAEEVICISVAAEDQMYVTESFVVTHNTISSLLALEASGAFPAIVVVPAILQSNWMTEIEKWLPHRKAINPRGRRKQDPGDAEIIVISYDVARAHAWIPARSFIADESHRIKNPRAMRSKACRDMASKIPADGLVLCLSGTPLLSRPAELFHQLKIVGQLDTLGTEAHLTQRYSGSLGRGGQFLTELNERIRSVCYVRHRKEDVLKDLPSKTWSPIHLEDLDLNSYVDTHKDAIAKMAAEAKNLERKARHASQWAQLEYLRQAAARAKLPKVIEWTKDFLETEGQLVLFAHHRDIVDALAVHFRAPRIWGGMPDQERQQNVDLFRRGLAPLIVCSIMAAGEGLNLTPLPGTKGSASDILIIELPWTPAALDQAADRLHRIGQPSAVTAWVMIAEKTIDSMMWGLLEGKRKIVNAATDGQGSGFESLDIRNELVNQLMEES